MRIFLADGGATPNHDRGFASKLAYHLTLLEPSIRNAANVREPANLLATVTIAERRKTRWTSCGFSKSLGTRE